MKIKINGLLIFFCICFTAVFSDSVMAAPTGDPNVGIRIEIENENQIRQGSLLRGRVILQEIKAEQKLSRLLLEIQFDKTFNPEESLIDVRKKASDEIVQNIVAAESQIISPNHEYSFNFQTALAENAPVSSDSLHWKIWAKACLVEGTDAEMSQFFNVKPTAAMEVLDKALLKLGYHREEDLDIDNDLEKGCITTDYMPIDENSALCTMICCEAMTRNQEFRVEFLLLMKETPHVKIVEDLTEKDEHFPTFIFPLSALFPDGDQQHPDVNYVTAEIQKVFNIFK